MTEEEASAGVVRIGVSVAPLVVDSVISTPLVEVVLQSHDVQQRQHQSQRPMGFVAPVGPQPVSA